MHILLSNIVLTILYNHGFAEHVAFTRTTTPRTLHIFGGKYLKTLPFINLSDSFPRRYLLQAVSESSTKCADEFICKISISTTMRILQIASVPTIVYFVYCSRKLNSHVCFTKLPVYTRYKFVFRKRSICAVFVDRSNGLY